MHLNCETKTTACETPSILCQFSFCPVQSMFALSLSGICIHSWIQGDKSSPHEKYNSEVEGHVSLQIVGKDDNISCGHFPD